MSEISSRVVPERQTRKHIQPNVRQTTVSMVATTPKPRVVKLIGGVAGLVAPLLGKQPPDTHVWVLTGNAPAFVKFEGPIYDA